MSSQTNTPNLAPSSTSNLPQPSPSPLSNSQTLPEDGKPTPRNPLEGVPDLTYFIPTDHLERLDCLQLIADSIAQQRQASNYAMIVSPVFIAIWIAVFAGCYEYIYIQRSDVGKFATTLAGLTFIMLALVRMLGSGYLNAAEQFNFSFLTKGKEGGDDAEEDILLGTKFGNEMIGAMVLRIEGEKKRGGGGRVKAGTGKGVIRAWTTKFRYRRKGVGSGMLEEAIRITREKAGKDAEVGFAVDHANSMMILPEFFNGHFRRGQQKAVKKLDEVLASPEVRKKR